MKRHFFIIIALLFCLLACSQPGRKELDEAKGYARTFLANRGADSDDSGGMRCDLWTDNLLFLSSKHNGTFVLMVRRHLAESMNERVLAFSIGTPSADISDNKTMMSIVKAYDRLVAEMECDNPLEEGTVKPMMGNIRWHQSMLDVEGQPEPVISGCGPVAVGQLMRHYEWPQGIIDWNETKSQYKKNDPEAKTIAPLMKALGETMKVRYGTENTNTQVDSIKPALVGSFSYSPEMFVAGNGLTQNELVRALRAEMLAGRPAIVCGCTHLWVCDGLHDGFLHFNMGWGGEFDGWYRFPSCDEMLADNKTLLRSAVLNILPSK